MVKVKLMRTYFGPKCALGELSFHFSSPDCNYSIFKCCTCEDAVRGNGDPATVAQWKIKGESAIPYGTYPLRLTWSSRFGRPMWQVCDVPGFTGIRIHAGNTEKDTEGCILLGEQINGNYSGVAKSRDAVNRFETIMARYYGNADAVIEILKLDCLPAAVEGRGDGV